MNTRNLKGCLLLVDAAGPLVQAGLWKDGRWIEWHGSREEAGRSLFAGVDAVLTRHRITIPELSGFLFCQGPGSMLGIRMAAMAIRGWQALLPKPLPVLVYTSLGLLARGLLAQSERPPFHVISDARRNLWNVVSVPADNVVRPIRRWSEEELAGLSGPVYRMEETVRNEPPVSVTQILPYSLEHQAERFLDPGLLQPAAEADPLILEAPEYKKWKADRHR